MNIDKKLKKKLNISEADWTYSIELNVCITLGVIINCTFTPQ